jgi:hypothetical protein
MESRSDILFIIICSNNKLFGGKPYSAFEQSDGIADHVDLGLVPRLMNSRREVLGLIENNAEAHLGGIPIRDLPLSRGLTTGPDFDLGSETASGQYMPAIQRYAGGFYLGLGRDRLIRVSTTKHHILIVSGLYGLVTPLELIQSYSCHVGHHDKIPEVWQRHDLISSLIGSYITRHKISTVLDLTADDDYRRLIAWEVVRYATRGRVLHAFSDMYAGKAALQSFGALLDTLLDASAASLRGIEPNDAIRVGELGTSITFVDFPDPPSSPATIRLLPQKQATPSPLLYNEGRATPIQQDQVKPVRARMAQDIRVTHSDIIGRMRRNILKVLADVLLLGPHDNLDFMPRVERVLVSERDPRERDKYLEILRKFNRTRNDVEYRRRAISVTEMAGVRKDYDEVLRWLKSRYGHSFSPSELEPVDQQLPGHR